MNSHPTNEEREALIAGDRAAALEPDEAVDLALLAGLLADQQTWAEPNAALESSVMQAVAVAAPATNDGSVTSSRSAARRKRVSRRRRITLSAVSAAAAIAAVSGALIVTDAGTSADFTAKLSATAAAPAARASADITRKEAGFRVVLDARGLPKLPAGEYYQAWLKNAAGTLVPIGTFSSSDGRVTLWSGVSPKVFHVISVTIESADGDQGSSGRRVLTGDVHTG
jgi:hypothetical protein